MHTYTNTYTHIHKHTHTHTQLYANTHTYIYIYIHTCIPIATQLYILVHTKMHAHMYLHCACKICLKSNQVQIATYITTNMKVHHHFIQCLVNRMVPPLFPPMLLWKQRYHYNNNRITLIYPYHFWLIVYTASAC